MTSVHLQALEEKVKEFEAKLEASMRDQGDLRTALMVKDKVLEDREKVNTENPWGVLLAFSFFVCLASITTPLVARVDVIASSW